MPDRISENQQPANNHQGIMDWSLTHAIRPFIDTIAIEPFNAAINLGDGVASTTNSLSRLFSGSDVLEERSVEKLKPLKTQHADLFTLEGLTETSSSALASAAVYLAAGNAGRILVPMASRILPFSKPLFSKWGSHVGLVLGTSTYDGLRDTREGETHTGNFAGTATTFTAFELLNPLSSKLGGYKLLGARLGIGAFSSTVGLSANKFSQAKLPEKEELAASILTGGIVNLAFSIPEIRQKWNVKPLREPNIKINHTAEDETYRSQIRRLNGYDKATVTRAIPDETVSGPFDDYADYLKRGVHLIEEPFHIRTVEGHSTKILLPAKVDKDITQLQLLEYLGRHRNEIINAPSKSIPQKLELLQEQANHLQDQHMYGKIWPRDLISLLDEVPDSRLIETVVLSPERHVNAPILKQIGDLDCVFGQAKNGQIWLWQSTPKEELRPTWFHEYAHLMKNALPKFSETFDSAYQLLRMKNPNDPILLRNSNETCANFLGEKLLAAPIHIFSAQADEQILLGAITGRALKECLKSIPKELQSSKHETYAYKEFYLNYFCKPKAQSLLTSMAKSKKADIRDTAKMILEYLSDEPI